MTDVEPTVSYDSADKMSVEDTVALESKITDVSESDNISQNYSETNDESEDNNQNESFVNQKKLLTLTASDLEDEVNSTKSQSGPSGPSEINIVVENDVKTSNEELVTNKKVDEPEDNNQNESFVNQKKLLTLTASDLEDEVNSTKSQSGPSGPSEINIVVENDLKTSNEELVTNKKVDEPEDNNQNESFVNQKKLLTLIASDLTDDVDSTKSQPGSSEINIVVENDLQTNFEHKNASVNESVEQGNNKINRKRLNKIDSDSEDDETNDSATNIADNVETASNDTQPCKEVGKTSKKRLILMDSDSDAEENSVSVPKPSDDDSEKEDNPAQKKKSRLRQLCDSDSEDEIKTFEPPDNSVVSMTFETDVDVEQEQTKRRLKTLCDSESSADETEETLEHISKENIIKQKQTKKTAEPTEKRMTGKEALEQRRLIKSESQKMVRETRTHLPYHRPKQHTLQEFLKRRNMLNTSIKAPPNTPTGLSIKMLNKEMKIAEKRLKQREKEIEEFYKSESEGEEEPKPSKKEETEKNCDEKSETEVEQTEEMIVDNEEEDKTLNVNQQEKIKEDEDIQQEKSFEEMQHNKTIEVLQETSKDVQQEKVCGENLEDKLSEENLQKKSSEDIQSVEEDSVEQMEVVAEEKLSNNEIAEETSCKTNELEQTDEDKESEQINDEFADLDESNDEEKEAKLQELRDILEKNLANNKPLAENNLDPAEESSKPDSPIELLPITTEKEENKKNIADLEEKLKKLNPIMALKSNLHPRLSGGPNELIVFDDDIEKSKKINNLMQRFLKHTAKKTTHKKSEVSIINVEGGVVHKEIISLAEEPDDEDEPAKKIQVPGVKMKKLRVELESQIMQKRLDEWKKRQEEVKIDNEDDTYFGEKEDCLRDKDLDNEEEEEMTDPSSSESEEEEDDIEIKETPRVKSAFVDEEAEESDEEDAEDEDEEEIEEDHEDETTKKPLRRIMKPAEDSDEEDEKNNAETSAEPSMPQTNATWDDNDDDIPPYQPRSDGLEKTPLKFATQSKNDITAFLSPTLHLTALQGSNSDSKLTQNSPTVDSFLPSQPSPLKLHPFIKTKLFSDQTDENLDELEDLCSGTFTTQLQPKNNNFSTQENELINICSGDFSGLTQTQNKSTNNSPLPVKSTQSLDLLNSEYSQTIETIETNGELKFPKMIIASSSEDEDGENESPKKKKQLKKRRFIIDDISITDEDELDEEPLEDEETNRDVNYDSEENEIEFEDDEEMDEVEKPARRATDFLDAEAELSESDWGSADEDEKNLDDYEVEEGDEEKINEKKVQRELERMHMRNVLEDDQRDVKMLQELLLEDGELHGSGRERKFRWKNADSLSWNTDAEKPKEEEEECEEIESELQWRKMRHEREMFLKEQKTQQEVQEEDFMNDSQIMKLGQKALKKSFSGYQDSSQKKTPVAEELSKSDEIKLPFALTIKRGSFLQRSETTLARLAEITRVSGTLGGAKNSKNFVFTSVEKSEIAEEEINIKKRKAEEGTPKALKKLRIADMSPNVQKRKKKLPIS